MACREDCFTFTFLQNTYPVKLCDHLEASSLWRTHLSLRLAFAAAATGRLVPSLRVVGGCAMLNEDVEALKRQQRMSYRANNGSKQVVGSFNVPTSICWFSAASLMGLFPNLSRTRRAPCRSNHRTVSVWPRLAAKWRGVAPSPSRRLGSTPCSCTCNTDSTPCSWVRDEEPPVFLPKKKECLLKLTIFWDVLPCS